MTVYTVTDIQLCLLLLDAAKDMEGTKMQSKQLQIGRFDSTTTVQATELQYIGYA